MHSLGPLFGFIVNVVDDSIFLVHEGLVNLFQFPEGVAETLEFKTAFAEDLCLT